MNMWNNENMVKVDCRVADIIRANDKVGVASSLTDTEDVIFTEWYLKTPLESTVLKEYRWPQDPDRKCEHWVPNEEYAEAQRKKKEAEEAEEAEYERKHQEWLKEMANG